MCHALYTFCTLNNTYFYLVAPVECTQVSYVIHKNSVDCFQNQRNNEGSFWSVESTWSSEFIGLEVIEGPIIRALGELLYILDCSLT